MKERPFERSRLSGTGKLLVLTAVWLACVAGGSARAARPALYPDKLAEMDAAVRGAVREKKCPGAVVWFEHHDQVHRFVDGHRALVPAAEAMTADTIFDAASLTKVLATTPSILRLVERGKLRLDAPVRTYLAEFRGAGRDAIRVRHLLAHLSGLRAGIPPDPEWSGHDQGIALACAEQPAVPPGTRYLYSDINFILLGEIVRRVAGEPLDRFAAREIHQPLRMRDTCFLPPEPLRPRIAPTEQLADGPLRGIVHDPTARRMGGVAGHAGLFTSAPDLARFARMMLAGGELEGTRVFRTATVALMTKVQSPETPDARRGLGWDIDTSRVSPRGELFPLGSYGHTGWTGTALWIDPFSRSFLIVLANRNHPTEAGNVGPLRHDLATLAAQAIPDFNFSHVPGALAPRPEPKPQAPPAPAVVRSGIDTLARRHFAPLAGLRVGLITNHSGHDRHRQSTIDLLHAADQMQLKALFSPEHGIRGEADGKVGDATDARTALPVYSLYGDSRRPSPGQLKDLDALVFDVQDIGCRFYTYISTLKLCLEAAAEAKLRVFVLDRVNPLNGRAVEGPVASGAGSFVACHPLPLRHGMTTGELARMFVAEGKLAVDLQVIPLERWHRGLWFDECTLPWTNPSPNMRSLRAATLYPGLGLLESALSVGRGTDTPFEVLGAPYIDELRLAAELGKAGLPGIRFVPVRFTPNASTFRDQACGGVSLVVTDREALQPVDLGITVALILRRLHPREFELDKMVPLLAHPPTLEAIRKGAPLAEIKRGWQHDLAAFRARREQYLLYQK